MTCYECGCQELTPCAMPDGSPCWWARPNLCSKCFTRITRVEHDPKGERHAQQD